MCAGQPLLGNQHNDELLANQCQSKHQRKRDESSETQQLTKYVLLSRQVILRLRQHGLGNAVEHVRDERVAHRVPLVGLCEIAHLWCRVEFAQHHRQDIRVGCCDDIRHDESAAEADNLLDGTQVDMERRAPAGEPVVEHADREREDDVLRGQAPIGIALIGHNDAHHSRQCHRYQRDDAALPHHHILKDVRPRGDAEADEEETEERIAGQRGEPRLAVEIGNERSREEEQ